MKILITGIGVSGKSSFRRALFTNLKKLDSRVEQFDADGFTELRTEADRTCLIVLPKNFLPDVTYIIEDVHATTDEAVLPLSAYQVVFYVKPNLINYLRFWKRRMKAWFASGQFSWERKTGWRGSGQSKDQRNVWPIVRELIRHLIKRNVWLREDYEKIDRVEENSPNFYEVQSFFKNGRVDFKIKFKSHQ